MHRFPAINQRLRQRAVWLAHSAQITALSTANTCVSPLITMQPVIVNPADNTPGIIFTPREQGVRWIQPVVLPQPCLVCWLCAGYLCNLPWATRGSAFPAGLSHQPVVLPVDPHCIHRTRHLLAGGFARLTQIHRRIKTNPATTDDGNFVANRRTVAQYSSEITQYLRMIDQSMGRLRGTIHWRGSFHRKPVTDPPSRCD